MAKRLELNDEELNKVSGGIQCPVSKVNASDVFLNKGSTTSGLIIVYDKVIKNNCTMVSYKHICKIESVWRVSAQINQTTIGHILSIADYSEELSGTISKQS